MIRGAFKNDDLKSVMEIDKNCYRMRNFTSPASFRIEDCLYDKESYSAINRKIDEMTLWNEKVLFILDKENISTKKIMLEDNMLTNVLEQNKFSPYTIISDKIFQFPFTQIGELINDCVQAFVGKSGQKSKRKNLIISSGPLVLKDLCCTILPDVINPLNPNIVSDLSKGPLWIEICCKRCGENCFVKNTVTEPFPKLMLKVLFSLWYGHVYAYNIDESNGWASKFPVWHECLERKGQYLDEIKNATIEDEQFIDQNKGTNNQHVQFDNFLVFVESFFDIYATKYQDYLDALADGMVQCYLKYQESHTQEQVEKDAESKSNSEETCARKTENKSCSDLSKDKDKAQTNQESITDGIDETEDQEIKQPRRSRRNLQSISESNEYQPLFGADTSKLSESSSSSSPTNSVKSKSINKKNKSTKAASKTKKKKSESEGNFLENDEIGTIKPPYENQYVSDVIAKEAESDDETVDLNEFLLDNHEDDYFLDDVILKKVNNRSIERQKSYYLEKKQELDAIRNTHSNRRGLKSVGLKKIKLGKEVEKAKAHVIQLIKEELWNQQATKDLNIQTRLDHIEFVKVKKRKTLHPVSDQYIKSIKNMSKKEKDEMMESKREKKFLMKIIILCIMEGNAMKLLLFILIGC